MRASLCQESDESARSDARAWKPLAVRTTMRILRQQRRRKSPASHSQRERVGSVSAVPRRSTHATPFLAREPKPEPSASFQHSYRQREARERQAFQESGAAGGSFFEDR